MIPDGATLMIGGFMGVGSPERLIEELVLQGKGNLTVIANDNAMPGRGIGKLVDAGLVSRTVASHIGLNPETQRQMIARKMEVDLVPRGHPRRTHSRRRVRPWRCAHANRDRHEG